MTDERVTGYESPRDIILPNGEYLYRYLIYTEIKGHTLTYADEDYIDSSSGVPHLLDGDSILAKRLTVA